MLFQYQNNRKKQKNRQVIDKPVCFNEIKENNTILSSRDCHLGGLQICIEKYGRQNLGVRPASAFLQINI